MPEVEAELSDDFSWWSPSSSGSSLRFANALPRFIAESYSTVVKPSLAIPAGQSIVDAISEEYFEMLNVGEIGLRKVSVPDFLSMQTKLGTLHYCLTFLWLISFQ